MWWADHGGAKPSFGNCLVQKLLEVCGEEYRRGVLAAAFAS